MSMKVFLGVIPCDLYQLVALGLWVHDTPAVLNNDVTSKIGIYLSNNVGPKYFFFNLRVYTMEFDYYKVCTLLLDDNLYLLLTDSTNVVLSIKNFGSSCYLSL